MKNNKSKGDRLNWTPLKEVKPVKLNNNLTKGKRVDIRLLNDRSSHSPSHNRTLLVP